MSSSRSSKESTAVAATGEDADDGALVRTHCYRWCQSSKAGEPEVNKVMITNNNQQLATIEYAAEMFELRLQLFRLELELDRGQ